ncbi:hypothetical protein Tco_0141795 [Tanacetum coccineum]
MGLSRPTKRTLRWQPIGRWLVTVVMVTRCSGHGGKEDKVVRRSRWGRVTTGGVDGVDGGSGGVTRVTRRGWWCGGRSGGGGGSVVVWC